MNLLHTPRQPSAVSCAGWSHVDSKYHDDTYILHNTINGTVLRNVAYLNPCDLVTSAKGLATHCNLASQISYFPVERAVSNIWSKLRSAKPHPVNWVAVARYLQKRGTRTRST